MISFGIILITRPVATASLFLLILGVTLILALVFRRRVFCQFLCPVGGFLGNYSMASMTEVRAIDPDVCRKHTTKSCLTGSQRGWGCPWNQYMGTMTRNNHCSYCMECVKSCPKDNIGVFLRPFGSDRQLKGYDEMVNVMIMLTVAMAFSVTMLGPWSNIKEAANITESRHLIPFLIYVAALWSGALVLVPGLFVAAVRLGNRWAGKPVADRNLTLRLAYMVIPIGIFAWIAFSLPSVLINHNYLLVVLSDPFGVGWNLFGGADMPFSPLFPQWIPLVQGILLLAGLFWGLKTGFQALDGLIEGTRQRICLMVMPVLYVLAAVNVFLRLYAG
jgi:ferredoxin